MAAVAISWYKPTAIMALNAEVCTKRCHTLKRSGHPTAYREIATGLAALAMTEGIVTRLRRFEQSDKLKFAQLSSQETLIDFRMALMAPFSSRDTCA